MRSKENGENSTFHKYVGILGKFWRSISCEFLEIENPQRISRAYKNFNAITSKWSKIVKR